MIRQGTRVQWAWGNGTAEGKVVSKHESSLERDLGGSSVVRHGSAEDPALLIRQDDGQEVLKLESEVSRADEEVQS